MNVRTSYQTLLVEICDGVLVITLNRPEVRNAISRQVQVDLHAALLAARSDGAVGAIVFTGAGERAFAAGADIGQLQNYTLHTGLASEMQRLYDEIEAFEKPTIAAVNGYALGGGCELAMACESGSPRPLRNSGCPRPCCRCFPARAAPSGWPGWSGWAARSS